jgi:D-xylose transport system substrate-binding protein
MFSPTTYGAVGTATSLPEQKGTRYMRKRAFAVAAYGLTAALALTACGDDESGPATGASPSPQGSSSAPATGKVGVILPDTQSSARWETADRPLLKAAFDAAGIQVDIQNAQNDKNKMATIADGMIQSGVKVLIITNLDSPSGAQIQAKAKEAGVKTIDYDRLTLGGSADYYVSFDNVRVGELQGEGLVKCLGDKANAGVIELHGSPTDNNATLFKQGYQSKLKPKYGEGWKKLGEQAVPGWDNAQAGVIFEQLLTRAGGKVTACWQPTTARQRRDHDPEEERPPGAVTGQDATVQGLQNILRGDQCMTVYKAIKKEADGAAKLAIALIKGEQAETNGTTKDTEGKRDVPSVLLEPSRSPRRTSRRSSTTSSSRRRAVHRRRGQAVPRRRNQLSHATPTTHTADEPRARDPPPEAQRLRRRGQRRSSAPTPPGADVDGVHRAHRRPHETLRRKVLVPDTPS